MAEITTKVCAVAFESFFKKAVLFKDAQCDTVSQKCLEAYASYGLKPSQITVKNGDQTFNYDLSFSLFNGNGTFNLSAEKLDVALQNATSERDLEIVRDCTAKIYEHVPLPEISHTIVTANIHATFASTEAMNQYLKRYANPEKQIVAVGTIGYIYCQNWKEEIRLTIDKSFVHSDSLYLMWTTTYHGNKVTRELLKTIESVFEESVTKFDLTFPMKKG